VTQCTVWTASGLRSRVMVKNIPDPTPNIKTLCTRLEQCRNQDSNPDSLAYKRKLEELVDEEDHIPSKQARLDSDSGVRAIIYSVHSINE
jgi:hypothetical protein